MDSKESLAGLLWEQRESFQLTDLTVTGKASFLCNICVVFGPVLAFGYLLFIHASTRVLFRSTANGLAVLGGMTTEF